MDDLVTIYEAAALRGLSVENVRWLHRIGLLEFHKRVGVRANMVRLADLDRALEQRRPVGRPRIASGGDAPDP